MKALIIDDELHCRNVIRKLVKNYCPEISLLEEANSVETGLDKIKTFKPDLVFLDIQLDQLTSFDLLEQLDKIDFQIIFTTAYDNYAIKAFEFAAVHYLLKPVIPSDLIAAVKRCENKELSYEKEALQKTHGFYLKTHENGYDIVYDQIVYIEADGSYSTIHNENNKNVFTSKKLGDYKELLNEDFFRIHNSVIVNMNFVNRVDKHGNEVILNSELKLPLSRRRKTTFKEALRKFQNKQLTG